MLIFAQPWFALRNRGPRPEFSGQIFLFDAKAGAAVFLARFRSGLGSGRLSLRATGWTDASTRTMQHT